jgi:hypothetical protein
MRLHLFFALLLAGPTTQASFAQIERMPRLPRADQPLIDRIDGVFELNGNVFSTATSISVSEVNGVRVTKVVDNGQKYLFEDDPASGLTCTVTKRYSSEDLATLEKEQPELNMHLAAIPKTIGNSTIEVYVDVATTYKAADENELEEKYPEVHQLYKKYTKMSRGGLHLNLDALGPMRIDVAPRGKAIIRELLPDEEPAEDDAGQPSAEKDEAHDAPNPDDSDGGDSHRAAEKPVGIH